MTQIKFDIEINGVLTDPTSVKLSDSTSTFGVKRNDTDAVVVADDTTMTNESVGVYSHTFTDPANDLVYTYAVEIVYQGEILRYQKSRTGPVTAASASNNDLTTAAKVKSYMHLSDTDITEDALTVYSSAGDASAATVEVTASVITLIITGGADAGTTTITLGNASSDTLSEVVSTINSAGGWTSTLSGNGSADSSDLTITASTACLGISNIVTLTYVDNYLINCLIGYATATIENEIGTHVVSRTYTDQIYNEDRNLDIYLDNAPITAVSRISVGRERAMTVTYNGTDSSSATVQVTSLSVILKKIVSGTTTTNTLLHETYVTLTSLAAAINALTSWESVVTSPFGTWPTTDLVIRPGRSARERSVELEVPSEEEEDYEIHEDEGRLYNPFGWGTHHRQTIVVTYTAGWTTVPGPLEAAANELVKFAYQKTLKDSTLKREEIGDYEYEISDSMGTAMLTSSSGKPETSVAALISPYIRISSSMGI